MKSRLQRYACILAVLVLGCGGGESGDASSGGQPGSGGASGGVAGQPSGGVAGQAPGGGGSTAGEGGVPSGGGSAGSAASGGGGASSGGGGGPSGGGLGGMPASTDSLGVAHPNLPPGFTPIHARFYLSRSTTQDGQRSTAFDPYYVGGAEGFDSGASGSENFELTQDATRPFQSAITKLAPGAEQKVGWFKLNAGDKVNQAWAATYMRPVVPGSKYYPAAIAKKYRRLYDHLVMKWHSAMPAIGTSGKLTFFDGAPETNPGGGLNLGSNSPNVIFSPAFSDKLSTTAPLDHYRFNLQGTVDNEINATIQGISWKQGTTYFTYPMQRDVWYSIEAVVTASTSAGPGLGVNLAHDGEVQMWMAAYDSASQSFGAPTLILDAKGLEISSSRTDLPNMGRSYMTKIQRYFQWAGSSVNQTYTGPDTGAYVALDYIAMSEN